MNNEINGLINLMTIDNELQSLERQLDNCRWNNLELLKHYNDLTEIRNSTVIKIINESAVKLNVVRPE